MNAREFWKDREKQAKGVPPTGVRKIFQNFFVLYFVFLFLDWTDLPLTQSF